MFRSLRLRRAQWAALGLAVLIIGVTDSGRGFSRPPGEDGLGLVSMRERVHFVGGQMVLQSMPGQGTRIDVRVPVQKAGVVAPASGAM